MSNNVARFIRASPSGRPRAGSGLRRDAIADSSMFHEEDKVTSLSSQVLFIRSREYARVRGAMALVISRFSCRRELRKRINLNLLMDVARQNSLRCNARSPAAQRGRRGTKDASSREPFLPDVASRKLDTRRPN